MWPALAKIGYMPGKELMGLFVRTCTAMRLEGFKPQGLANIINGKDSDRPAYHGSHSVTEWGNTWQALPS
jgi:hypothetical protein